MDTDNPIELSVTDTISGNTLHERYLPVDGDKDYFITNVFQIYKELREVKKNARFIPAYAYPKPKTREPLIWDKVMIHKPTSELIDSSIVGYVKDEFGFPLGYNPKASPPSCEKIKIEDRYVENGVIIDDSSWFYRNLFIRTQDDVTENIKGWQTIFWPSFTIVDEQSYNLMCLREDKYVKSFYDFFGKLFPESKFQYTKHLYVLSMKFMFSLYAPYRVTFDKMFDSYTVDFFEKCDTEEKALETFFINSSVDMYW